MTKELTIAYLRDKMAAKAAKANQSTLVVQETVEDHIPTGVAIDPVVSFNDFKGQDKAKALVLLSINAWEADRSEVPGHMLFTGPGGTGKTTIAHAIANRMGTKFITTNPHLLRRPEQIFEFFFSELYRCKISHGDVIFIDEIHGFNMRMAGFLYNVLQDFRLDYSVKTPIEYKGKLFDSGDVCGFSIPPFLCIGATTDAGLMHPPLRSRFLNRIEFEEYGVQELAQIVAAYKRIEPKAALAVARRSGGNPRFAKAITLKSYLVAKSNHHNEIKLQDVVQACKLSNIDEKGLDKNAQRVVQYFRRTGNRPAGTSPISAATQIYKTTLDGEVFPSMAFAGVLLMTSRGKCLTEEYYEKIK